MALIKCPECGKEISDQAISCVTCGARRSNATPLTNNQKQSYTGIPNAVQRSKFGRSRLRSFRRFPQRPSGIHPAVIIVGVLILIGGGILIWYALSDGKSKTLFRSNAYKAGYNAGYRDLKNTLERLARDNPEQLRDYAKSFVRGSYASELSREERIFAEQQARKLFGDEWYDYFEGLTDGGRKAIEDMKIYY